MLDFMTILSARHPTVARAPKGHMSKEEFFGACKLIAVKQNGGALDPTAFALAGQPLPKLGASGDAGAGATFGSSCAVVEVQTQGINSYNSIDRA